MAGGASLVARLPVTVVSAEPRRKTTDSVRRMLRLLFGAMPPRLMVVVVEVVSSITKKRRGCRRYSFRDWIWNNKFADKK